MKTGALIAFSCEAGAILAKASGEVRTALRGYAHDLGLAFQIADDLLDVEGSRRGDREAGRRRRRGGKSHLRLDPRGRPRPGAGRTVGAPSGGTP